jgi:hypothetical protein
MGMHAEAFSCPVLKLVVGLSFGHGVHIGLAPTLYVLIGHLVHVSALHIHLLPTLQLFVELLS